jgi:hypothetical protein
LGVTYTSTVTIAVVYDGEPKAAYFSYHYSQTLPTTTPTGEPLIVGDLLLYVPKDESEEWIDTDPQFGHTLRWDGDSWESTTDSQSIGTVAKDAFRIARESGKVIFSAVIYTEALVAANIQAGEGTDAPGSGFRFRALDDDYSQGGAPKVPIFDVTYHGVVIFRINPSSGEIFFGENFIYDPVTQSIRTPDDNMIIDAEGKLYAKGAELDDIIVNGLTAISGIFSGLLNTHTIKTGLATGPDLILVGSYSTRPDPANMYVAGVKTRSFPIGNWIPSGGTAESKTIAEVKFEPMYDLYDRWRVWFFNWHNFSATGRIIPVRIKYTDGTERLIKYCREKQVDNWGSSYPAYPTFSSDPQVAMAEGFEPYYNNEDDYQGRFYNQHVMVAVTDWKLPDPSSERLYIENIPSSLPTETNRVWRDTSGYLRIV